MNKNLNILREDIIKSKISYLMFSEDETLDNKKNFLMSIFNDDYHILSILEDQEHHVFNFREIEQIIASIVSDKMMRYKPNDITRSCIVIDIDNIRKSYDSFWRFATEMRNFFISVVRLISSVDVGIIFITTMRSVPADQDVKARILKMEPTYMHGFAIAIIYVSNLIATISNFSNGVDNVDIKIIKDTLRDQIHSLDCGDLKEKQKSDFEEELKMVNVEGFELLPFNEVFK